MFRRFRRLLLRRTVICMENEPQFTRMKTYFMSYVEVHSLGPSEGGYSARFCCPWLTKDSVSTGKERTRTICSYVHPATPRSSIDLGMLWVQTLLLLVMKVRMVRRMSKVLIRTWGLAYTSSVERCRPTEFMSASSNSLMLTSEPGSKVRRLAIGALRFGSSVTRTLS